MGGYPRRRRDVNHISAWVKYIMFFCNFGSWLVGGFTLGAGLWAYFDKVKSGFTESPYQLFLDASVYMIIVGLMVFMVSWAGCIGALRENSCLLKVYSGFLLILFLCELALAMVVFLIPKKLAHLFNHISDKVIDRYREDADLKDMIDYAQINFQCCGLGPNGYKDWSSNEYFNCTPTNLSAEKCAVPYSCCRNASTLDTGFPNFFCGYDILSKTAAEASMTIWMEGCIDAIEAKFYGNLHIVGGIAVGVAMTQLLVIFLARTLEGQIQRMKSQWTH